RAASDSHLNSRATIDENRGPVGRGNAGNAFDRLVPDLVVGDIIHRQVQNVNIVKVRRKPVALDHGTVLVANHAIARNDAEFSATRGQKMRGQAGDSE